MNEDFRVSKRTKWSYSLGGIGRDMAYTLVSMYIMVFFTDAIGLADWEIWAVSSIIAATRIWDAINDPMMGVIIDNTRSRWGKFKPWVIVGAVSSAIFTFLLFQDFGLRGVPFAVLFAIFYLSWEITFTMNDISYWSMYPSFTTNPKERESICSFARFFANLGAFLAAGLIPFIYPNFKGGPAQAFFWIALVITIAFISCQTLVVVGVKEKPLYADLQQPKTRLRDFFRIIIKNDQLIVIFLAFLMLEIANIITINLGPYFFNYDFGRYGGGEFTIFLGILAVTQLLATALFPTLSRIIPRKQLFSYATISIIAGYLLMLGTGYLLPLNMAAVGAAGFLIFCGQAIIQVLMYLMIADTIEYGHWKLGTRNESLVFAARPFATKFASSIQALLVAATLTWSGLNDKVINPLTEAKKINPELPTEVARAMIESSMTSEMRLSFRITMMVIPILFVIASYLIYRYRYKIDSQFYSRIISDLEERSKGA
ncbi:MAG TPA: glycoside-pentoside-hexuronide (GPH):cation symporter [Bacillota bacterium]|nr:sugar transporter [Bacillota bacterium]HPT34041.1 glycoside-pentoside-hexuronide (GPH):cation symporter [Bacillota bacterium]